VKPGDWLSKYSWAIYGNYTNLDVFARWDDQQSKIKEYPIQNKDQIAAGETIIHYPTYEQHKKGNGGSTQPAKPVQPGSSAQPVNGQTIRTRLDAASWNQRDDEARSIISAATPAELYALDVEAVLRLYDALTRKPGWYTDADHNAVKRLATGMKYQRQPTPQYGVDLARSARLGSSSVQLLLTTDLVNRIYAAEARRMAPGERWAWWGTIGRGQLGQPAYDDVKRDYKTQLETCLAYAHLPSMMARAPVRWSTFDWTNYRIIIPPNYNDVFTDPMVEDFVVAAFLGNKILSASKTGGRSPADITRFAVAVYHGAFCSVSHAQHQVNDTVNWAPVEQYLRTSCTCTCIPDLQPGHQHTDLCDYVNEVVP
jgi:hypothetical protein